MRFLEENIMSKYQEFCASFWAGKAKNEEEQLLQEEREQILPQEIGKLLTGMCEYLQCPLELIRYADTQANMVVGTLESSPPPIKYDPEEGRHNLDLEIGIRDQPGQGSYPVWLHFTFVPLKHITGVVMRSAAVKLKNCFTPAFEVGACILITSGKSLSVSSF
jgi:hypothetical protein